jgi:hypothetical protein
MSKHLMDLPDVPHWRTLNHLNGLSLISICPELEAGINLFTSCDERNILQLMLPPQASTTTASCTDHAGPGGNTHASRYNECAHLLDGPEQTLRSPTTLDSHRP